MRVWRGLASAKYAVGMAVAVALIAGCGVPAADGPQPVDSDIAQLLQPEPSPTSTVTAEPRLITVTWVRGDSLARAQRAGSAETRQQRLDVALATLLDGPRPAEQIKGSTTLLPPDLQVTGEVLRRRAVIELTVDTALESVGLPLAVGQVAVTALSVPRVRTVVFSIDGVPTPVPLPNSRGDARIVSLSDYRGVPSTDPPPPRQAPAVGAGVGSGVEGGRRGCRACSAGHRDSDGVRVAEAVVQRRHQVAGSGVVLELVQDVGVGVCLGVQGVVWVAFVPGADDEARSGDGVLSGAISHQVREDLSEDLGLHVPAHRSDHEPLCVCGLCVDGGRGFGQHR